MWITAESTIRPALVEYDRDEVIIRKDIHTEERQHEEETEIMWVWLERRVPKDLYTDIIQINDNSEAIDIIIEEMLK